MKLGIHHREKSFSDRWIEYCVANSIDYKLVDCYSTDIIFQLEDCDALMWHWNHFDPKAVLFARQLTRSLETIGKIVFPNSATSWHFDDKIGQKYLLEAIGAPLVPSFVFYSKGEALDWVETKRFPIVFKLRGGAGSVNVRLVRNLTEARKLIKIAFGSGFSGRNKLSGLKDRVRVFQRHRSLSTFSSVVKGVGRLFVSNSYERMHGKEKGYVYFQDFLEGNLYDTRIIVIGSRSFAIRRYNRKNDFRASGSGLIEYDHSSVDVRFIKEAFKISRILGTQSIALDFIVDDFSMPRIVEISYGFATKAYNDCPGYWDEQLNWYPGEFIPQHFMVSDLLSAVESRNESRKSQTRSNN